ncbi:MAG: MFS transporter [Nitrososphaeria archaeon]|nr:MFS transporter [Nitrososphaeria archaeon]NDB51667.1 MFS transporter [Nitrosopumilaceae archaeon]NDB88873.1 MFS transporter [Nitrososphaerota archaeon]NDB63867.1 MFS transporter [Nitrosopumilaceae archaeon]NDB92378.1 MFS transporter [Nitrososphaeria archaeon]
MNRTLLLVNITGLLIGISYGIHNPIVPIFAKNELGASYAELGLIGLANFVPYMFIPIFVGMLVHKFNSGRLLCIGIGINTVSVFLLTLSKSVPEVMILRAMTGVAHAFFWPPAESIVSNVSEGSTRVKNIARFTGFFVAGFMIGPLIGTILLEGLDVSYRMLFEVATFVMVSSIIFAMQLTKKQPKKENGSFSFSAIKQVAKFPVVIMILIYCASSFGMILTIHPAFLNDRTMSATQIEILYFVFGASRVVTLGLADKLARNTSLTLIASTITIAAGLAISFASNSIVEFSLAMLLMGFGFSIIFPLTLEIILRKTPKENHGVTIGAYETTFGIGWAIGPVTAGLISEFSGNAMPYLVFFGAGIIITIISAVKKRSLEPVPNSE